MKAVKRTVPKNQLSPLLPQPWEHCPPEGIDLGGVSPQAAETPEAANKKRRRRMDVFRG